MRKRFIPTILILFLAILCGVGASSYLAGARVAAQPLNFGVDILSSPCGNADSSPGGQGGNGSNAPTICGDDQSGASAANPIFGPSGIITSVIKILSIIVGVAAIIMIIVSALRMVLANGDSNDVSSARNGIIYALVGLLVAAAGQAIVTFVLNKIGSG